MIHTKLKTLQYNLHELTDVAEYMGGRGQLNMFFGKMSHQKIDETILHTISSNVKISKQYTPPRH